MAIRRPNKPPTAATEVFNVNYQANGQTNVGFVPDTNIAFYPVGGDPWYWTSRLMGNKVLNSNDTGSQDTSIATYWNQPTNTINFGTYNSYYVNYVFKRAPGFHDVVTWTGTGSNQTVYHNLGVTPELIITKKRTATNYWSTFTNGVTSPNSNWYQNAMYLNTTGQSISFTGAFSGSPTATTLPFSSSGNLIDSTVDFVAYLFATKAGISKVGTYTGTGNAINIDCGFSAGARFVMIKRTDAAGDWYVFDTARGIVSGNDPYVLFNSTDAQTTNTDYIDPLNAGFTVTSSAPAALNASSGNYIFLAIA